MNRLTRKAKNDETYDLDYMTCEGDYYPLGNIVDIVDKLGKLEDLEELLGCPLEIVITPYFKRGKLEVFYHNKMREVIRVVAFEEATRPYMEIFYRDNEKEKFKVKTIWLDDYKKTWWLKEDRSE